MKNKIWIYFILCVGSFYSFDSYAQILDKGFYRITNQAIGERLSLDIIKDSKNDRLQMAKSSKSAGQLWKFTLVNADMRYYRLTTQWLGETKALTLVLIGDKMQLRMANLKDAQAEDAGLQHWSIEPVEGKKDVYIINNVHSGPMPLLTFENKKIDIVFKENMTASQYWKLTLTK